MSKKQVEKEKPNNNTLVISFRDPYEKVRLGVGWNNVCIIECDDVDPNELNSIGKDIGYYTAFNKEHAERIICAVKKYLDKNIDGSIIVHCGQGRSRSTATGKFLSEVFKIADIEYIGKYGINPNKYIYEMLIGEFHG